MEQVAQLRDVTPQIHAAGAELVVVGNGKPKQARWFVGDLGLTTPVFTDPTLEVYRAARARRGWLAVLHPSTLLQAFRAWRKGHRQKGVQGDPTQLGGTFVIAEGGQPVYEHRSRSAGDHASPALILQVLQENVRR